KSKPLRLSLLVSPRTNDALSGALRPYMYAAHVRRFASLLLALTIVLGARGVDATISSDRYEIQARLSVQNSFQHNGASSIDWVQERNELRFDLKYDLVPAGEPFLGFISKAKASMLYRGR